jgi:hypothetical protein
VRVNSGGVANDGNVFLNIFEFGNVVDYSSTGSNYGLTPQGTAPAGYVVDDSSWDNLGPSALYIKPGNTGAAYLQLMGAKDSRLDQASNPFTPQHRLKSSGTRSAGWAYDKWTHIFFCADVTNDTLFDTTALVNHVYPTSVWPIGRCFIDGVDCSSFLTTDIYGNGTISGSGGIVSGTDFTGAINPRSVAGQSIAINGYIGEGFPVKYRFSSFPISIVGSPIGIPNQASNATRSQIGYPPTTSGTKAVDYGDTQVWFGTYIDPSVPANFAKFVNIVGGKGLPVDPAIAELAFGRPTFRFIGDHTKFPTNTGTGGAFSLVGTDIDFTPTPSYG